jgi:hypothetical protein
MGDALFVHPGRLRPRDDSCNVGIHSGLAGWLLGGFGLTLSAALLLLLLALLPFAFFLTLRERGA